jgi:hypothetical protein
VIIVSLFILLVMFAVFTEKNRQNLLLGAFSLLVFGWIVERLFSSRRSRGRSLPGKVVVASVEIEGRLTISDQLLLSESKVFEELPRGVYKLSAETSFDGHDYYVAAVSLLGPSIWSMPRREKVTMAVDTGFLIFLGAEASHDVLQQIKNAQNKILTDETRDLDVEIVTCAGKNVGFVTATGLGDGQYTIELKHNEDRNPWITCRFLDGV